MQPFHQLAPSPSLTPTNHLLEVTTHSDQTRAAIAAFIHESLCYGRDAESMIHRAIAADPTCAIAHAYAAGYYLSQESAFGRQQAMPHLRAAQRFAAHTTDREQLYVQAIACWANGQISTAIAIHDAIAERYPQDLMSVQQGQYHAFYLGDQAKLLQIAEAVLPTHRDNHFLLGMLAFGLEQCHRFAEAEAVARAAIALNRQDPWAHHAIAHVMETQKRTEEGIAWMEAHADTWETCNSMLYTHNWWHIALYYLANGATAKVLSVYDTHVWGRARHESPKDQVGAIALLMRLELQGIRVDESRWRSLVPYLLPRLHEHALPFQDLHFVYALARAERFDLADEMLISLAAQCELQSSTRQTLALPAAKGLVAYAAGDWHRAIAYLQPVLPRLHTIGGSHAQRELFDQIYRDAVQRHHSRSLKIAYPHRGDTVQNDHQTNRRRSSPNFKESSLSS